LIGNISRTKKVLLLSLGKIFNTLAFLISGIIAARILTKHDYATLKQTFVVYNTFAPLLALGLGNVPYYFLPKEENKKSVIINNIILLTIMGMLFSLFLLFGGYKLIAHYFNNKDLETTLKWMIPYPIYTMPVGIISAVLLVQNKTLLLTKYQLITNFLLVCLIILGIFLTKNYYGPLIAQIYFPLVIFPITLYIIFKNVPGRITPPKINKMVEMLKYSIPLGVSSMLGMFMLQTDKIIVSSMTSPIDFANYINGAIEIPLIGIITGSIASVILVDMVKYIDQGNKLAALNLFKKAALKSASILFPVMIFFLLTGKFFILTLYSEKYIESVLPFTIYLFILPVRIIIYGSALMALGMSKIIMIRSFFDLIFNILLSILMVKIFGYIGAAIATILILYLWTVPYNLYFIAKGFGVKILDTMPLYELLKILIISILSTPFLIVFISFIKLSYTLSFLLSIFFYFPLVFFLLYKYGFLDIPNKYLKYILLFKGK